VQNSQAQCNPLRAFALMGYGKPTVALPPFGAIQNCPVPLAVGEKVSPPWSIGHHILFSINELRK
jgi:hypothetical protein